ncbi:BON domain-containing protein [Streptomyces sp. NPDC090127]|uniref:BON domain-containing protein n=1 Tax=Streptomyces sp. NPDC090127 TaxID=3365953 RepID=UPI003805A62F
MTTGDQGAYLGEYRIERVRDRLAREDVAELGIQVELRGGTVLLSGTVSTEARREEILRLAQSELAGVPVRADLVVVGSQPPTRHEELP